MSIRICPIKLSLAVANAATLKTTLADNLDEFAMILIGRTPLYLAFLERNSHVDKFRMLIFGILKNRQIAEFKTT